MVQDSGKLTITMADGHETTGRVIGTDPKSDLALIKIDTNNLQALKLGDSDSLKTGELILAVGIPSGLSQTVTLGIVSAVGRSNVGIVEYEDFIQTDAAINPGNSGGALVNSRGELVGVNTAIFSTSGGSMGVGFAIPARMAKTIMESLIEHGKVIRSWLGVNIQNITPELARHFSIEQRQGVLIADVGEDSPAAKAGLERGDIITAMDGKEVRSASELKNMVAATLPHTRATLSIIRQGEAREMTVTLGEYPEEGNGLAAAASSGAFTSIHVEELNSLLRSRFQIPAEINGVIIDDIDRQSEAFGILRPGDVIRQINRQSIVSLGDYEEVTKNLPENADILLLIYRNGVHLYVTIEG